MGVQGRKINGTSGIGLHFNSWQQVIFVAAYGPLLAWGPLLGIVTVACYRHHCGDP
jgi:hypothetical protein